MDMKCRNGAVVHNKTILRLTHIQASISSQMGNMPVETSKLTTVLCSKSFEIRALKSNFNGSGIVL